MVDAAIAPCELPKDLSERFELWAAGIPYELGFWTHWAKTRGGGWPEEFAARMNPDTPLVPWLGDWASKAGLTHLRVLDVGAGPVTSIGYVPPPGMTMEVVATDPLADAYTRIFDALGLVRPVPTSFAPAEELSAFLPSESFDIVHCRNALDHSFDPIRGLEEMLRLVKLGGQVMLYHNPNEAESEGYSGFHQYNFDVEEERFIIWRGATRWDVQTELPIRTRIRARRRGHISVLIEKRKSFPPERNSRFRERFAETSRALMNLMIRRSLG
ncbi:MAG: methyltransferase domain-containing protein [Roseococcus sp.]